MWFWLVFGAYTFANSQPSVSNFKTFSRSQEQFILTVGQNNFGNKIPFFVLKTINGTCCIVLQTWIYCFDKLLRVFFFCICIEDSFEVYLRDHFSFSYGFVGISKPNIIHRMHLNFTIDPIHLSTYPSLNTQSSIRRPLCSTFRFENLSISPKKNFFKLYQKINKNYKSHFM